MAEWRRCRSTRGRSGKGLNMGRLRMRSAAAALMMIYRAGQLRRPRSVYMAAGSDVCQGRREPPARWEVHGRAGTEWPPR